eukprot:gene12505-14678_t
MSVYQKTVSHAPASVKNDVNDVVDDDDWDSDPNYVNDISEKDSRWGSKIIRPEEVFTADTPNMQSLREKVFAKDAEAAKKEYEEKRSPLYGGERAEKSIKH